MEVNRTGHADRKINSVGTLLFGSILAHVSTNSWQLCRLDIDLSLSSCPDKMEMEKGKLHGSRESSRVICLQVLPSYLFAGLGMVTAGMLLDHVQVSDK